jgi:hypothetical protein
MNTKFIPLAPVVASLLVVSAFGQAIHVYPAKGQSADQMQKDKQECATWAQQQSGYNPSQPVTVAAPPPQQGQVTHTAARGAAAGAAGGAIAGDAGKGAAIGAASGALVGGVRKRNDAQAQQAQTQAAVTEVRSSYERALKACLEGKGYTVK